MSAAVSSLPGVWNKLTQSQTSHTMSCSKLCFCFPLHVGHSCDWQDKSKSGDPECLTGSEGHQWLGLSQGLKQAATLVIFSRLTM